MNDPATDEVDDEPSYQGPSSQVRLFVSENLIRVGRDATVRQMAHRMAAESVGALVVVEVGHVHGVVSERDVVLALAAGKDLDTTTAGDLDSRHLVMCTPDTSVHDAAQIMVEHYVRHLVVQDETGPVGMISARDLNSSSAPLGAARLIGLAHHGRASAGREEHHDGIP